MLKEWNSTQQERFEPWPSKEKVCLLDRLKEIPMRGITLLHPIPKFPVYDIFNETDSTSEYNSIKWLDATE
jgi:hypothetical protein